MDYYRLENVFVTLINICFLTYSINRSSNFRKTFEKIFYLAFICTIIFLSVYWNIMIWQTYDTANYRIISIGIAYLNISSTVTLSYFGISNKLTLGVWLNETNRIICLIKKFFAVEVKLQNYRKFVNLRCLSCVVVTTLIWLVEVIHPVYTQPFRKVKISNVLGLLSLVITWYLFTWLMVTSIVNCTLMVILTKYFEVLTKVKEKFMKKFHIICWLVGRNVQELNLIFQFATFGTLCHMFANLTFGSWVYSTTNRRLSMHLCIILYSAVVTVALTETSKRLFASVSSFQL